jgi:mannose-6-phosphate isomerase-like protein (cupin superfamily)
MRSRDLLRSLGMPADAAKEVARLEKSLHELKQDVDSALRAFVARTARTREPLELGQARPADAEPERSQPGALPPAPRGEPGSFDPSSTYVCLSPSGGARAMEVTPEFWHTINEREELRDGRLVAVFAWNEDWAHWEMHPHGEEVLLLLSGRVTMVFEESGALRDVELHPGRACIVPSGTWHRATVPLPSRLLAITYGRGTAHRER